MSSNIRTFFVHKTFRLRLKFDALLFKILNRNNHWELLEPFKGKDVLIVGNGPSLRKTELERIKMVSIGMNKIDLLFDKTTWRPDIITCVNGLVTKQNRKYFNTTNIILVLPARAWYLGIKHRKNVLFVRTYAANDFMNDVTKGIDFCGSTVTYTALQIAATLNPKSVNIVGVDHNFTKNVDKKSMSIDKFEGNDDNHFDPNYFKGQLWGLPDLEGSEVAYSRARKYFDGVNIPIIDYTIGGKCQIFNKGDINIIYQ